MNDQDFGALTRSVSKAPPFDESSTLYDICFVMNVNSRGWILDKICQIIGAQSDSVCYYLYSERNDRLSEHLPRARNYFFAHFAIAFFTMKNNPEVFSGNCYVWYTHPDLKKGMTMDDVVCMARACAHVFTPCSTNRDALIAQGVDADHVSVPLGGADPALFTPKIRNGEGAVGFVGAYYPRKQPERMLELAKLLPHRQFILLGPCAESIENPGLLWTNWDKFAEFSALPNVTYAEGDYKEYPAWYAKFDVLCSTSLLEGGPIPAIEAMMSNVVPVLSDTGFARDIISHTHNGFIFDTDATAEKIAPLIEQAMQLTDVDVAATVQSMSWSNFGREIWHRMQPAPKFGDKVILEDPVSARRYLRHGFHPPEARGVWMCSQRARIVLPVDPDTKPELLEISVWGPVFLPPEAQMTGQVSAIGGATVPFSVGTTPVILKVPLGHMTPTADGRYEVNVTITLDEVFDPEAGTTNIRETRVLGLKVGWLQLS